MKKMLDLLYAGESPWKAQMHLPVLLLWYYTHARELLVYLSDDDLTTMLMLIAVSEGKKLWKN